MSTLTFGKVGILKRETFVIDEIKLAWIPNYENKYAISQDGQIWSAPRKRPHNGKLKAKWLKPGLSSQKYLTVVLDGKTERVHKLVAITWIYNPNKKERIIVDHENRNKTDNTVYNLRWVTTEENAINRQSHKGVEDGSGRQKNKT